LVLEIAEQHSDTVFFAESVHGFVQHRKEVVPGRLGRGIAEEFIHGIGLLFPRLPPLFCAIGAQRYQARGRVEPAGQRGMLAEALRLPGEFSEDLLRHVLGAMDVAACQSQRGGIDEIHVPPNQFGESGFPTARRRTSPTIQRLHSWRLNS